MSELDQPGLSADALIDQMFTLWIVPHIEASNLDITRDQVVQALVVLHPNGAPEVKLNEQAELVATVQVRGAVASGEPVTAENVEHVSGLRPAEIEPDAGWIAFAFLPGGGGAVAFDFRYNRDRAGDVGCRTARPDGGDGDFLPTIESLQSRGLRVKVVSWSHAVNRQLRDAADEFVELDSYFDQLTWTSPAEGSHQTWSHRISTSILKTRQWTTSSYPTTSPVDAGTNRPVQDFSVCSYTNLS